MIGISRLYCGTPEASDALRYPAEVPGSKQAAPRVVVFNCTARCNLRCMHCYSASRGADDELSTEEAGALLDDLAKMGVGVVLFSGGEPLMREDIIELVGAAASSNLRAALSTNGVGITTSVAERLAAAGLGYAGVSIDGVGRVNDTFRGRRGAFREALAGLRRCRDAGIKVGLRFTMTRGNVSQIPAIFDLLASEDIRRVCFYHLVPAGRGKRIAEQALSHPETRQALERIMDLTAEAHAAGRPVQVLTVDNHADGPYVCLRLMRENNDIRAQRCMELLRRNGGNSSGQRLGCVRWNGEVLADQFWAKQVLGNVRQKRFSRIWTDPETKLLSQLRDRARYLRGRCPTCRWLDVCNGNLRARAAAAGDMWADDPACYLSDEEIA